MLVAVLSDVHDNIWNLEKALAELTEAEALIFCGDLCAPFSLEMLAEGFSGPVHVVLGNNDGDLLMLSAIASRVPNVSLYTMLGRLNMNGREIAFTHYPALAEELVSSGRYDAVFSGHTHRYQHQRQGRTLWVNPGEVMGRYGEPGYVLYDTSTGEALRRRL